MPVILSYVSTDALVPVTFQQVTVSDTVQALIIPVGVVPTRLILGVQAGAIRVRWDGGVPTTTVGHLLQSSSGAVDLTHAAELIGTASIERFRMIRDGTQDAVVAYTIEQ